MEVSFQILPRSLLEVELENGMAMDKVRSIGTLLLILRCFSLDGQASGME